MGILGGSCHHCSAFSRAAALLRWASLVEAATTAVRSLLRLPCLDGHPWWTLPPLPVPQPPPLGSYSYGAHMRTFAVLPCTYAPPPPSPPTAAAKAARARVLPASDPINAKNGRGYTKLWLAADRGEQAEVARLLGERADPNIPHRDGGTPVLYAACYGHLACAQLLVAGGGDLTIANKNGITPLSDAEKRGHTEIAAFIRAQGVSH
jgi:ankyrin repeat protein